MAEDNKKSLFNKSLGGYSVEDVDKYVEHMNNEYLRLKQRCKDSDRKLLHALRKLDERTNELQKAYSTMQSIADDPSSAVEQLKPAAPAPDSSEAQKALEQANAEAKSLRAKAAELKEKSEKKAVELIRSANAKAGEIIKEADAYRERTESEAAVVLTDAQNEAAKIIAGARLRADGIVAGSAQRAREAAEKIIKDAAISSRKMIKDAETKANTAIRDVVSVYRAAEEMYSEVSSFRGSLFALYSDHIESIQTITGSAHELVNTVDGIVRGLESSHEEADDGAPAESPNEPDATEMIDEENDEEILASLTIEYDEDETEGSAAEDETVLGEEYGEADEIDDETDSLEDEPEEINPAGYGVFSAGEKIEETEDKGVEETVNDDQDDVDGVDDNETDDDEDDVPPSAPILESDEDEEEYFDSYDEIPEEEAGFGGSSGVTDVPAESDDFILPDDISGGTNVLDIVKGLGGETRRPTEDDDFYGLGKVLGDEFGVSADEFSRVFSNDATKDINQIMIQPDAHPIEPTNPKKHSKF